MQQFSLQFFPFFHFFFSANDLGQVEICAHGMHKWNWFNAIDVALCLCFPLLCTFVVFPFFNVIMRKINSIAKKRRKTECFQNEIMQIRIEKNYRRKKKTEKRKKKTLKRIRKHSLNKVIAVKLMQVVLALAIYECTLGVRGSLFVCVVWVC